MDINNQDTANWKGGGAVHLPPFQQAISVAVTIVGGFCLHFMNFD
jgi:hypothetical protein